MATVARTNCPVYGLYLENIKNAFLEKRNNTLCFKELGNFCIVFALTIPLYHVAR